MHTLQKIIPASLLVSFILTFFAFSQQEYSVEDAPGELSRAHSDNPGIKNCLKCHNEELDISSQNCLACHKEIALRISEKRGYHRDKTEDCSACHVEHQGEDVRLFELDTEDFDHAETGYKIEGAHSQVSNCRSCHTKEKTYPRKTSLSYLMKTSGCPLCHTPPHPGRQEVCLACHSQENWRVEIQNREDFR